MVVLGGEAGPGRGAARQSPVTDNLHRKRVATRRVGGIVAVVPENAELDTIGALLPVEVVALDVLRAIEGPELEERPSAGERIPSIGTAGAAGQDAFIELIGRLDPVTSATDRQQVLEAQSIVGIPALTRNEVIDVRIVAACALARKIRVAIDISVDIFEVSDRDDGIEEQPLAAERPDVLPHDETHDGS